MNTPEQPSPPMPPHSHPLAARMIAWVKLRDELAELSAQLEYLRLLARIQARGR